MVISLSIGFGQFAHAVRRNLNVLYIMRITGSMGSPRVSSRPRPTPGSKAKKKDWKNKNQAIDPVAHGNSHSVAALRPVSFSGDKGQLVPLIKAGLSHPGCAVIDVISPCVTFNDHEGSTRSYAYTRSHLHAGCPSRLRPVI